MKRPGLLLAVFVVALLGWVTLNSVATETAGSQGAAGGGRAAAVRDAAVDLACRGRCDANVATKADQGAAGAQARRARCAGRRC